MNRTLLVVTFLYFLSSCSNDDLDLPSCRFNDATQELSWLKLIIEDREANPSEIMKYCYIEQAKLKRKRVFVLGDCNPLANKAIFLVDCEGNTLKDADNKKVYANKVGLKDRKIIWKPADFACDFGR